MKASLEVVSKALLLMSMINYRPLSQKKVNIKIISYCILDAGIAIHRNGYRLISNTSRYECPIQLYKKLTLNSKPHETFGSIGLGGITISLTNTI